MSAIRQDHATRDLRSMAMKGQIHQFMWQTDPHRAARGLAAVLEALPANPSPGISLVVLLLRTPDRWVVAPGAGRAMALVAEEAQAIAEATNAEAQQMGQSSAAIRLEQQAATMAARAAMAGAAVAAASAMAAQAAASDVLQDSAAWSSRTSAWAAKSVVWMEKAQRWMRQAESCRERAAEAEAWESTWAAWILAWVARVFSPARPASPEPDIAAILLREWERE